MKGRDKFDVGTILPIEFVQRIYQKYGVAHIVTDGRYVQIEKEPIRRQTK